MAYLYILKSKRHGIYYIGSTANLSRRLSEHNRGQTHSTKSGRSWECVFSYEVGLTEAKQLEKKLKSYKSKVILDKIIADGAIKSVRE